MNDREFSRGANDKSSGHFRRDGFSKLLHGYDNDSMPTAAVDTPECSLSIAFVTPPELSPRPTRVCLLLRLRCPINRR